VLKRLLAIKLAAGKRVKLTLKLSAAARKAIVAALAKHQQVTLTLTGTASAAGSTPGTAQLVVTLTS
jgi:hypothetical protein